MIDIFSSGGGTQSAAIAALIVQGRLPKPKMGVIADTGREHGPVWAYHEKHIVPALASVGVPMYRVHKDQYATVDLWSGKLGDTVTLPAYTSQTGEAGKLPTYCSNEWKVRVVDRFLTRDHGLELCDIRKWIGFTLDETKRITRIVAGEDFKEGRILLPLVQIVPIRRKAAIKIALDFFGEEPPRSACWMCPNRSDPEWLDLKVNHPEEFLLAVQLEKEVQKIDPFAWLHRSCIPLDEVDFTEPSLFESPCDSGNCFV